MPSTEPDKKTLELLSDPSKGSVAKASSVLQRNVKLYGPMNALQCDNPSTSWNSDGTASGKQETYFIIDFDRAVIPVELRLQFQAGFAAEEVAAHIQNPDTGAWELLNDLEMEDAHGLQTFDLLEGKKNHPDQQAKAIKLVFEECTDFYGRIIIYQLQIWGHELPKTSEDENNQDD